MAIDIASLGEIARRLDVPLHRVEYVVRSQKLEPLIVAGGRNFYSEATVQHIKHEPHRIEKKRGASDEN